MIIIYHHKNNNNNKSDLQEKKFKRNFKLKERNGLMKFRALPGKSKIFDKMFQPPFAFNK